MKTSSNSCIMMGNFYREPISTIYFTRDPFRATYQNIKKIID